MKKLYTLTLATAVALSASAANEATLQNAQTFTKTSTSLFRKAAEEKSRPARAAATDYDSYEWTELGLGKYQSSVVADTYSGSNELTEVTVFEAVGHAGVYKVVGVWPDLVSNGTLIVDASDPTFVKVPKQFTGIEDTVDGVTYIASQTYLLTEIKGYSVDEVKEGAAEIVPALVNGCINFAPKALMLNWPEAPADSQYGTDPEGWYIGKSSGVLVLPGAEYVEPWTLLGEGTFTDNLLSPSFGIQGMAPYTVPVLQSTSDENLYKVEHPWKGFWMAQNWSSVSPSIELDATDPDNVILPMTSTGISGNTDGLYSILSFSYYALVTGSTVPAGQEITLTKEDVTEADGTYTVRTFTFNPKSCLLSPANANDMYYMGTISSTLVLKTKKDATEGVESIETETNAPVKYFNLQGVEISEPAAGSIVIRVQGDKATKTLIR